MLINGRLADSIAASDRGLAYGDGVFETIAWLNGEPALWQAHMRRLVEGCRRLGLPPPPVDRLLDEAHQAARDAETGVVKIVVTAGSAGRGYRRPTTVELRRLVSFSPFPEYPQYWWRNGARVRWCELRLAAQPALAGIKHLNRLEQVLARAEWTDPDIAEGLLCDADGHVIEGTMSNVFLQHRDELWTPRLDRCGVAGVMAERVEQIAERLGWPVRHTDLTPNQLGQGDGVFLTNSVIGVLPVTELGGHRLQRSKAGQAIMRELQKRGEVRNWAEDGTVP